MKTFDAAVVGGGLIGGAIALELARCGQRAVVLERGRPGEEASWAAAGMLSPAPDSPEAIPLVPLGRASLELYPEFISRIEELSGHKTGYRREGTLELILGGEAERELSTLIALHHGLGLPAEPLRIEEARDMEPAIGPEARAAAWLPYEASVDNRALTAAVFEAAKRSGVEIRAGAPVTALAEEAGRVSGVIAGGERVEAKTVILAAGCWSSEIPGISRLAPTRPARGQMLAVRASGLKLRRVIRSPRGYVVPRDDARPQRLIIGSTVENAGFEKRVTPGGLAQILTAALELVPALAGAEIVETWAGLRPDTPDHLPILGPADKEGLVLATGHFRNGILLTPITAKLIREWVTERRTSLPLEDFSPLRFTMSGEAGSRSRSARPG